MMITFHGKKLSCRASDLTRPCLRAESGFSLLELSIVMVLIALITVMAMTSGIAVIATARQTATTKKMAEIDKALMAYRAAYNRIPCPGNLAITQGNTAYGVEASKPGSCVGGAIVANFNTANGGAAEGAVPTVTLGLANDFMYDGWGNHIRYIVDTGMTSIGAFASAPPASACVTSNVTVCDFNGVLSGACVNTPRSSAAVYVLVSHGKDTMGGVTNSGAMSSVLSPNANEKINCHAAGAQCQAISSSATTTISPIYVQADYSISPTDVSNLFDDIVSYKERSQMTEPWDPNPACSLVYVADYNNYRVQKLSSTGTPLMELGGGGDQGSHACPVTQTFCETASASCIACTSKTSCYCTWGFDNGDMGSPTGVAVDANGNIWAATGDYRVQKFGSNGSYMAQIGCTTGACASGSGNGQFGVGNAQQIAFDNTGNIWVGDWGNNRAQEFSPSGTWVMTIGGGTSCTGCTSTTSCTCIEGRTQPSNTGMFDGVAGIAVDKSGNIWISDYNGNRIEEFSSAGAYMNQIGCPSTQGECNSNQTFFSPGQIAFDSSGYLWVADGGNNRVVKMSSSSYSYGTLISQIGCASGACAGGSSNGSFSNPFGLAIDTNGNVWVADQANNRIQIFSPTGTFIRQIGSVGSGLGQLNSPRGLAVFTQ
jgi:prepilin-type N-terminal cleavage/methylation domain-containing protein